MSVKQLPITQTEADLSDDYGVFGDFQVSQDYPQVQIDAIRGLDNNIESFTSTGGSVSHKTDHGGKEFQCTTGTSVGGYGLIRSKRVLRYRPGQPIKMRFTARFDTAVALLAQRAGGIGVGTELSFGHNGSSGFGVLHRTGGRLEVRTLTLSAAATGNETATITLDGTAYTASLTSGTKAHNAFEIASDSDFGVTKAWQAFQNGDTVIFIKSAVGTATGSYSFSTDGTGAGSIAQTKAGSAVTDSWYYQSTDWITNDPFGDGSFDPTKGNIYQIEYGYLGYANIKFSIYNPNTAKWVKVYDLKYPNSAVVPHLDIPNFKIGWFAASLGSTTDSDVFGASAAGYIGGPVVPLNNPVSQDNEKTSVGTSFTNILSIRVRPEINGFVNLNQVLPQYASVAVDGTKPAQVEVLLNATLGGEPNWTFQDQSNSIVEYDTAGTTATGGTQIAAFSLNKTGDNIINLRDFRVVLDRTDTLTVAVKATSGTTDVNASIGWVED